MGLPKGAQRGRDFLQHMLVRCVEKGAGKKKTEAADEREEETVGERKGSWD